jgi:hypothetical protein
MTECWHHFVHVVPEVARDFQSVRPQVQTDAVCSYGGTHDSPTMFWFLRRWFRLPTSENETLSRQFLSDHYSLLIVFALLTLASNNNNYYCAYGMSSSDATTMAAPPVVIPDEPRLIDTSVSDLLVRTLSVENDSIHRPNRVTHLWYKILKFFVDNNNLTHAAGSFVSLLYFLHNQERDYPTEYEGHFERLVITREEIRQRVHDLGKEINQDYTGRRPVLLCVLKGANPVRLLNLRDLSVLFLTQRKMKMKRIETFSPLEKSLEMQNR